jgi:hypothetical protein
LLCEPLTDPDRASLPLVLVLVLLPIPALLPPLLLCDWLLAAPD